MMVILDGPVQEFKVKSSRTKKFYTEPAKE